MALQEERLNREKRTAAFPVRSIERCLSEAGAEISDVDVVAVPQDPRQLARKVLRVPTTAPGSYSAAALWHDVSLAADLALIGRRLHSGHSGWFSRRDRIRYVRHHRAHAASSFLLSPFDRAAILTMDGIGELETATLAHGTGTHIRVLRAYEFPFSLGKFYGAVCRHLGFMGPSKEGTVMGLAAYGDPSRFDTALARLLQFDERTGEAYVDRSYFEFGCHPRSPSVVSRRFAATFGPARDPGEEIADLHRDLAAALQATLERAVVAMLRYLHGLVHERCVCLAGGVALNSMVNGKIYDETPFEQVFIQPAANDAGLAIGGALDIYNSELQRPRLPAMTHAYWGSAYNEAQIQSALTSARLDSVRSEDVAAETASALVKGKTVGWFQGRSELGPRALGARSILADARSTSIKDTLNRRIKHREPFRPFAPAVLEEDADKFFELDHPSPYMLEVHHARPEARQLVPAIVHVDGSARVQTVNYRDNALFYQLLRAYRDLTGIGVLLNTSFNDAGEPIVESPADAIGTFLRADLDVLVMGAFIVEAPQRARQA